MYADRTRAAVAEMPFLPDEWRGGHAQRLGGFADPAAGRAAREGARRGSSRRPPTPTTGDAAPFVVNLNAFPRPGQRWDGGVETHPRPARRRPDRGGHLLVGTRVSMIAIPWFVLSTTGSATQTGLVAAVEITPLVIFKALGSAPRSVGPRRVTLACDLALRLRGGAIPLCTGSGCSSFPTLLVLVAFAGALRGPGDAGKAAMTPRDRPGRRGCPWSGSRAAARSSGPPRWSARPSPVLIAWIGAANSLYVDAALVPRLLRRLRVRHDRARVPCRRGRAGADLPQELREGWRFLRTEPVLIAICAMVATTNLIDQAWVAVLMPVWAKESGAGVAVPGTLFAVMSGASVLGALVAARWGETLPRYRTYVVAFLFAGAPRSWRWRWSRRCGPSSR